MRDHFSSVLHQGAEEPILGRSQFDLGAVKRDPAGGQALE